MGIFRKIIRKTRAGIKLNRLARAKAQKIVDAEETEGSYLTRGEIRGIRKNIKRELKKRLPP